MDKKINVVIVGAGVAGMTAAIYLKRAGINCTIIENMVPGGQILKAFKVENYPGFMQISGSELSNNIFEQVKKLHIDYIKDEVVKIEDDKKVVLKSGNIIETDNVIIATGRRPKKLNVPNLNKFLGKGLSYCATCDGRFFKDQDVLVVGGSNSALEEALYLANICKSVTIIHRRDELRADRCYQDEALGLDNVTIKYNTKVKELISDGVKLDSVIMEVDGNEEKLKVAGCFSSIGYEPNTDFIYETLDLNDEGYIKIDDKYMTNRDGIYAIGDVVKKESYLLLTAMSDAVNVASIIINNKDA